MSAAGAGPADGPLGVVGLGNMGGPMSRRLVGAGWRVIGYDAAGTAARLPGGAGAAGSVAEVAGAAAAVLLSLPDGDASIAVARDIAAARPRRTAVVVDTSTIGIEAARAAAAALEAAGVAYVDAPVSGGVAGAEAGTLAMMIAAEAATVEPLQPMLASIAGNRFHVGATVGQGQAMKLLNNFLSGTAMAATAEAVAFGLDHGLDMETMLDVLNASSGQNTATSDKYPRRVLTGTYDAGFATRLIAKDVALYERRVAAVGARSAVGAAVCEQWRRADAALPGSDFTRIFDYVRDSRRDR